MPIWRNLHTDHNGTCHGMSKNCCSVILCLILSRIFCYFPNFEVLRAIWIKMGILGKDSIYCSPPSQVALRDSKTSPRPVSGRVSWCLETSSIKTPFLGWISVLSSFVSLFIFYVLSYLLSKTMGCFSGHLMTSARDQKLFCEVCSAFRYSFDEFVGEKVVSPSYSSAILGPPPEK